MAAPSAVADRERPAGRRPSAAELPTWQLVDDCTEDVGHYLQDVAVGRRAAGRMDRVDRDLHPTRVKRHRHLLAFDNGPHVAIRVARVETVAVNARGEDGRRDFRLEPRQHDSAAVSGRRAA